MITVLYNFFKDDHMYFFTFKLYFFILRSEMRPCSYYSYDDTRPMIGGFDFCSRASDEHPIIVNCTGRLVSEIGFVTDHVGGREDLYLLYLESGELSVFLGDKELILKAGNAVIFPPKYRYKYSYSGEGGISYLWVHFTGSYAERLLSLCGLAPLPFVAISELDGAIINGFQKMFKSFEEGHSLRKLELANELEDIILKLSWGINGEEKDRKLQVSLNYIHSFFNRTINIPSLAKMEHLSNSYYIELFKRRTGLSPSEYIINLRMNAACDMLRNSDLSIKHISVSVGYDDVSFFSKIFKKKTGMSPLKYRMALK